MAEKAFGLSRLELATHESHTAGGEAVAALDALIARRLAREPVARILGEKEFYGLSFVLNEATLVPRPETELIVDKALAVLKGRVGATILDLGTGTGCLPIAVLANAPGVAAVATDLSERALAAARENAQRHGVAERIAFAQGSWFEALSPPSSVSASGRSTFSHEGRREGGQSLARCEEGSSHLLPSWEKVPEGRMRGAATEQDTSADRESPPSRPPPSRGRWDAGGSGEMLPNVPGNTSPLMGEAGRGCATEGPFVLIVSNPPYIESDAIAGLSSEVREYDPRLALDGGPDGLDPYRTIAKQAPRYLKPGGWLMVEIGSGQGAAVAGLLDAAGFSGVSVDKDLAGLDRVVSGHHV
ncbi:hypothetical protein GCM10010862_13420 [Devosia nitrariae]|uniref:Release factor glutamine methyltransferase n=1 Tax=Devosia nitrariae TaxID=2071872 RepID=A0ABQ5W2X2_9HYPH|nr:hypothetical protein GCM10010862_13420 [Devosia nitrariae]